MEKRKLFQFLQERNGLLFCPSSPDGRLVDGWHFAVRLRRWSMLMSTIVLVANLLGLATGKWNLAPRTAQRGLNQGIALLLIAIVGLGYANQMQ